MLSEEVQSTIFAIGCAPPHSLIQKDDQCLESWALVLESDDGNEKDECEAKRGQFTAR